MAECKKAGDDALCCLAVGGLLAEKVCNQLLNLACGVRSPGAPVPDDLLGYLRVELEPPGFFPVAERLMAAGWR